MPKSSRLLNLMPRILAIVGLIWFCTIILVISWTGHPTRPSLKVDKEAALQMEIRKSLERSDPELYTQDLRAKLVLTEITLGKEDEARKILDIYKDRMNANPTLPLLDRIQMHDQVASILLSLKQNDAAIKEYDINLKALSATTDYQELVAKAKEHNNRGVAHFLWSQSFEGDIPKKEHLKLCKDDFAASKAILDQLKPPAKVERTGAGVVTSSVCLSKILGSNRETLDQELIFTPASALP